MFTKLSKYDPSLLSNPSDKMIHFLMGASKELVEECNSTMLHDNMDISLLMVHDQQVEETSAKRESRYAKRTRSFDGCSSKGRHEIQDKPRFKKRVSNQVHSKFPKARDYMCV